MYPDDDTIGYHARACHRYIESAIGEFESRDARRLAVTLRDPTDRDGWALWAADSILDGLHHCTIADRQEQLYAFRSLLLAREYRGRCGGFLPAPLGDALACLQNAIERVIATGLETLNDRDVAAARRAAYAITRGA